MMVTSRVVLLGLVVNGHQMPVEDKNQVVTTELKVLIGHQYLTK
jgi:hypothetical protein